MKKDNQFFEGVMRNINDGYSNTETRNALHKRYSIASRSLSEMYEDGEFTAQRFAELMVVQTNDLREAMAYLKEHFNRARIQR